MVRDRKIVHKAMSAVHSKNTSPEKLLRKVLWNMNCRYRINCRDVLGKPDICIKKYKICVFVDGDFWHGHVPFNCCVNIIKVHDGKADLIADDMVYYDPNYQPKSYYDSYKKNPANLHRLTDEDADLIRNLNEHGYNYKEITEKFFPNFSISTISDICRGISHNR